MQINLNTFEHICQKVLNTLGTTSIISDEVFKCVQHKEGTMEKLPKNEILKQLKQQFINGTLGEYDPKYKKNVAAWEKSRQAGA